MSAAALRQDIMPGLIDFIADTHVHLYEGFDLPELLISARDNLRALAPSGASPRLLLCLTERAGCDHFHALARGIGAMHDQVRSAGLRIVPTGEGRSLRIRLADGDEVTVIAGRQIATRERLELLVLATEVELPDGRSLAESVVSAQSVDGAVVLNWSPGKWMFGKYPRVEQAVRRLRPGQDFLGDVAMRPYGWSEPQLIRLGRAQGVQLLAGSDPLPLPGEERLVGTYGIAGRMEVNETPAASFLAAIRGTAAFEIVGRRSSPLSTIRRFLQNRGQTMYRTAPAPTSGSPSIV